MMHFCNRGLLQNVSRETLEQLKCYVMLLEKWQKSLNLISRGSTDIWQRHIEDSAQLAPFLLGDRKSIIDMGSGAGLPAIVLAILQPQHNYYLLESDRKKSIFLQEAVRELGLRSATILNQRLEEADIKGEIVTARALAELDKLIGYAIKFLQPNAFCLFLKGKNWDIEVAKAKENWHFEMESFSSVTSEEGRILKISQVDRITY